MLPLRALYPLTAQPHSMGELSAYRLKQHPLLFGTYPSAGYSWRYDMGGHQTVLDVALTYGFIANRGEQQSFSGSDVYEEIGLGNSPMIADISEWACFWRTRGDRVLGDYMIFV